MTYPLLVDNVQPPRSVSLSQALGTASPLRRYEQGQTIREIGRSDYVGYVVTGSVKLVKLLPDGHTSIIGLVDAPGFFGSMFGISGDYGVEAATDASVRLFRRDSFEAQLLVDPGLEHLVHVHALRQLESAYARALVLACSGTMQRTAAYLVLQLLAGEADDARSPGEPDICLALTRRDLAAWLGTTVETVSRNLQALGRRGTIEIVDPARFNVLRRADLFQISGYDEDDLTDMVPRRGRPGAALAP
ncbi:Crp/Fnr family transcriptional regulator [Devosia albogilva]|uniref:Crp/Fnr family transcriptional regulator n=1 Tax=Devosia albogilva TaxID=429726 RepID=A0ABW5QMY3_9HYPH